MLRPARNGGLLRMQCRCMKTATQCGLVVARKNRLVTKLNAIKKHLMIYSMLIAGCIEMFFFFKNSVKNKKPVIICEGKTDITYLQCVLESQAAKHRSIIINKELKISFFKPIKTISELFKVTGGTGDIGNLISNYSSYCDEFKRFSLSHL